VIPRVAVAKCATYGNLPPAFNVSFTFWRTPSLGGHPMNTIIYIVGLVVIIGLVLSFLGFR
jgi:hypothetical protein